MSCFRSLVLILIAVIICALALMVLTLPLPSDDVRVCPTTVIDDICFGGQ